MALQDTIEQLNNLDLNNMDWSRIGVWPLAGRLIVWLLVMAAIVVGAYFFFVKDLHVELDREITSEESLKRDFENKAYQAAKLELYKELMEKMDKDFEFLVSQLPRKTKIPSLLDDIDEKGRESGLAIDSIKLKPEVVSEVYIELPIDIIVEGSYHNFGTFISSIAGMSRIVTLHDYTISKGEGASALKMTISAKTYYRSSNEGEGDK